MGGLDAINIFLLRSASALDDLKTVLNARKSTTPSRIITKERTSWLRSYQRPPAS